MANRGARVVAIDLAEQQLAFARHHEEQEPLGVEYHLMNACDIGKHWGPDTFDLATGCMSLHDMADPEAVLRSARRVVKAHGRMVFSIPHPFTDTPHREWEVDGLGRQGALKIDHYFESGPATCRWRMRRLIYHWDTPYWRYTLPEWATVTAEAGWLIRWLHEPRPTRQQVHENANLDDAYRLPAFLIFELVKDSREWKPGNDGK